MIVLAARSIARIALVILCVLLIGFAVLTLLARLLLPMAGGYKETVETRLGDYLSRPVSIGELHLAWRYKGPELRIEDVFVYETETRSLSFRELRLDLDVFGSFARRALIFDELTLIGADLTIDHAGDQRFTLHGGEPVSLRADESMDLAPVDAAAVTRGDGDTGNRGLDVVGWLFDARRVGLLETRLTINDQDSGQQLELTDLNVRAENEGSLHRLRVDVVLPAELGERLEAGVDLEGSSRRLGESSGSVVVKATDLHLAGWRALRMGAFRELVGDAPGARSGEPVSPLDTVLERLGADADVEMWADWMGGRIVGGRSRLTLHDVRLDDPAEEVAPEPLFERVEADLAYQDESPGWRVEADHVTFSGAGESIVIENVDIGRGARESGEWHARAGGKSLPLSLASRLPVALYGDAVRRSMPSGRLASWTFDIRNGERKPRVSMTARAESLRVPAGAGYPGIEAIDAELAMIDNRGTLTLAGRDTTLVGPDLRLEGATLDARLRIDGHIPEQWRADGHVGIEQASLTLNSRIGLTLDASRSPAVDLQGSYAIRDLTDVPPWLSLFGASPSLGRWFDRAFVGGQAENGTLTWFGRLADFPHADGRGVLTSAFDLVEGELAFLPDWPHAMIETGRVELDGVRLRAASREARLGEMQLSRAEARIDNLFEPALAFEASGRADLQSLVDFGRDGPLRSVLGGVLADAGGSGLATLDIALDVPLGAGAPGRRPIPGSATGRAIGDAGLALDGALFLDGNSLGDGRADVTLEDARGAIGFTESGIRIGSLRATAFGRPVTVRGETSGRGDAANTEVQLSGVLEASDVLSHYAIPLDRFVRGASRWNVVLRAPHSNERLATEGVRLLATSDLLGTELLLPAPLEKSSGGKRAISVSTAFRDGETRSLWRIDTSHPLRLAIDVDDSGLLALGARFGKGRLDAPAEGIRVQGHAARVALDDWATALSRLIEDLPVSDGEPELMLPVYVDLTTDVLLAGIDSLGPASLQATTDERYLDGQVENEHLSGSVRYPRAHWQREEPALIRIDRIDKAFFDALAAEDALSADEAEESTPIDPRSMPAMSGHVSSLAWDALALEDVSFTVSPTESGITFVAVGDSRGETKVDLKGHWRLRDGAWDRAERAGVHESAVALTVAGADLGLGLSAVGYPDVLDEGSGTLEADVRWRGPLYLPDLASLSGRGSFDIARGAILPIDPGAARMVGLFALQSLPRRLSFDFRDVTSDGLAFERINGEIRLDHGLAEVILVQLTGPIGVIDVSGTSNLVTREYDQRITVLPRISAALPIIGVLSAGATGGIGALVAGGLLKAIGLDIDRIGLQRYSLTGSFDEPVFGSVSSSRRPRP